MAQVLEPVCGGGSALSLLLSLSFFVSGTPGRDSRGNRQGTNGLSREGPGRVGAGVCELGWARRLGPWPPGCQPAPRPPRGQCLGILVLQKLSRPLRSGLLAPASSPRGGGSLTLSVLQIRRSQLPPPTGSGPTVSGSGGSWGPVDLSLPGTGAVSPQGVLGSFFSVLCLHSVVSTWGAPWGAEEALLKLIFFPLVLVTHTHTVYCFSR